MHLVPCPRDGRSDPGEGVIAVTAGKGHDSAELAEPGWWHGLKPVRLTEQVPGFLRPPVISKGNDPVDQSSRIAGIQVHGTFACGLRARQVTHPKKRPGMDGPAS
jgi:hypothetical protein